MVVLLASGHAAGRAAGDGVSAAGFWWGCSCSHGTTAAAGADAAVVLAMMLVLQLWWCSMWKETQALG